MTHEQLKAAALALGWKIVRVDFAPISEQTGGYVLESPLRLLVINGNPVKAGLIRLSIESAWADLPATLEGVLILSGWEKKR